MAPKKKKNISCGALITQRNNATQNIQRIHELITTHGKSLSIEELDCRLEIIEVYFQQALDYQLQIEQLDDAIENINAVTERGNLEDLYCGVKAHIRFLMKSKAAESQTKTVPNVFSSKLPENLPKLKLPTFSGKYSEFPNFIRLFRTLVHGEVRLNAIEKFNHLLSCLSGPALHTIKTLDISEENYEIALALLESRFSNKFLICQEHIKELFHLNKVQKGSSDQLRLLIDTVTARYNALLSLVSHEELSNALIVHLVIAALDNDSQSKIEESIDCKNTLSWNSCSEILKQRCQMLESRDARVCSSDQSDHRRSPHKPFNRQTKGVALTVTNNNCACCKQTVEHALWKCTHFLQLSPLQRFEYAKNMKLCINCLSPQHTVRTCKSSSCKQCKSMHHTLLHRNNGASSNNSTVANQQPQQLQQPHNNQGQENQHLPPHTSQPNSFWSATAMVSKQFNDQHTSRNQVNLNNHTILATATVNLYDKFGTPHLARALLDSASQLNFITRSVAQKLNLNMTKSATVVGGIGESHTTVNCSTTATISSRSSDFVSSLTFLVMPSITGLQPDCEINIDDWKIPSGIKLADPKFHVPQKIDLLLGADIFFQLFDGEQIKLGTDCPSLLSTEFGWIVSGRCKVNGNSQKSLITAKIEPHDDMHLEVTVKQFWDLEKLPEATPKLTKDHTNCENHFKQHVQRNQDGRFMVKLPFKTAPTALGDSKNMAIRRFFSQERRLSSDAQLKEAYSEFLAQYESEGHMEQVPWPSSTIGQYFLPHHCILRPEKSTTKCRVVFDASAKSSNNVSLNDILMVGPVVQKDLFEILLRFRLNKFGLMADIAAMYRQIHVYDEDRNVQNIVWRNTVNEDLKLYKLKTVTYGTSSAPYLATRCLVKLAEDNLSTNPFASNIVLNDFYVDDLISGGSSLEEIKTIKQEVSALLKQAQFHLRKWHSNHQEFLNCIPEDEREKLININNSDVVKALGIIWDSNIDCFKFNYKPEISHDVIITKRRVLSQLAKLFDPIGLINPIKVKVKVFLQELWIKNLNWDEPIPEELSNAWKIFTNGLMQLNNLRVPRFCRCISASLWMLFLYTLHGCTWQCDCKFIRCQVQSSTNKCCKINAVFGIVRGASNGLMFRKNTQFGAF